MKKRNQTSQTIARALEAEGLDGVVVDVDRARIAYLSGEVGGPWQEARAVEIAYESGAEQVEDGLSYPGRASAHLRSRPHAVTPYLDEPHHCGPDESSAQRLLHGVDLSHRIFDGQAHPGHLRTGNPIAPQL